MEDLPSEKFTLQMEIDAGLRAAMKGMLGGGGAGSSGVRGEETKIEADVGEVADITKDGKIDIRGKETLDRMAQSQLDDLRYIQESFI